MNYSKMLGGFLPFREAVSIDMQLQAIAPNLSVEQREEICRLFEGNIVEQIKHLEYKIDTCEMEIESLKSDRTLLEDNSQELKDRLEDADDQIQSLIEDLEAAHAKSGTESRSEK